MPHYDDVTATDCSVEPRHPVQSLAHPYDQHGWTLASTGVHEANDGHKRILRSHMLHYMDATWDPYGSPGGTSGAWRHTFELDSLAFELNDGSYYDPVGGPPGGADWYVPEPDGRGAIDASGVRIRPASSDPDIDASAATASDADPPIAVRRGQDLLGYVDGERLANCLQSGDSARAFADAIGGGPGSVPTPSTRDLEELAAEFEGRDEFREANAALATTAVSVALTLGAGTVPGTVASLGLFLLSEFGGSEPERDAEPIPFDGGFEGVLDHAAPVQGHRVVFDVYQPRCTDVKFTVESSFGERRRSAKWHLTSPAVTDSGCGAGSDPTALDPSTVPRADAFAVTSEGAPSLEWGNDDGAGLPAVAVESLGDGRYAFDASASVAPEYPTPGVSFDVYEWTSNFDPAAPDAVDLGDHLFENYSEGPVQCVQVATPGSYVVRAAPNSSSAAAWERFRVSKAELEPLDARISGPQRGTVGEDLTFGVDPRFADSMPSYNWHPPVSDDADAFDDEQSVQHAFSSAGSYELTVEVETAEGEHDEATWPVTIEEPDTSDLDLEVQGPDQARAGDEVNFGASVSGLQSSPSFNWDPPVGDADSSFDDGYSQTHVFEDPGTHVVGVSVSTDAGAGAYAKTDISIRAQPSVEVTADDTTATAGTPVDLEVATAGFDGEPTLTWEDIDADGSSVTTTWNDPGTHSVEVTAEYGDQRDTDSVVITVTDPDVRVEGPTSGLTGNELTFEAVPTGFASSVQYNWLPPVGDGDSSFDDSYTHSHVFEDPGTYEVEVAVSGDAPGEAGKGTLSVDVDEPYDPVSVELEVDESTVQTSGSVTFDATASGGDGSIDFKWPDVTGSGDSVTTSWNSGGTYDVSVEATDGRSSDSDSVTVTVREPSVEIEGPTSATVHDELTFEADATDLGGGLSYNWHPPVGDGSSSFDDGATASHTFTDTGDYDVTVSAESSDTGIGEGGDLTVTVDPDSSSGGSDGGSSGGSDDGREPTVTIEGPTNATVDEEVTFEADVTDLGGGVSYNWHPPVGDGSSSFDDGATASHTFTDAGDYDVTVSAESSETGIGEGGDLTVTVDPDTSSGGSSGGSDDDGGGSGGSSGGSGGSDNTFGGSDGSSDGGDDDSGGSDDGGSDDTPDCVDSTWYSQCQG